MSICFKRMGQWDSCQISKIAGCACAGNAGNVFPGSRPQTKPRVSDPSMQHASASRTCRDACWDCLSAVAGKMFPVFSVHAHPQFYVSGKRPMSRGKHTEHNCGWRIGAAEIRGHQVRGWSPTDGAIHSYLTFTHFRMFPRYNMNTLLLRDAVRQTSQGKPAAARPTAADFQRDICLTVSRNHKVVPLSSAYI